MNGKPQDEITIERIMWRLFLRIAGPDLLTKELCRRYLRPCTETSQEALLR